MNTETTSIESGDENRIDSVELLTVRNELISRCKNIGFEVHEDESKDFLEIQIPAGREKRWMGLYSPDHMRQFLALPFERYSFLSDYHAICSYQDCLIEAAIRSLAPPYGIHLISRRLFPSQTNKDGSPSDADVKPIILTPETSTDITIILGPASETLQCFCRNEIGGSPHLSLQLLKAPVSQHDQAVSLLEKLSNSLFFQIDLVTNIPLALTKIRRNIRRNPRKHLTDELQYPRAEYDKGPVALYWYAKSAVDMPLLQFLAFYQVLEFYFPTYYQAETHRRIRAILKDPTFRNDRDSDLSRILSAIQISRSGNIGDERSQLRATISECVASDILRGFLEEDEKRRTFFSTKTKGLTDYKLQMANDRADLRNDVADRLYDIRCKIVHTKNDARDGQIELLLPFSKEADQLQHDIALIEFIARRVLIAASSELKW